MIFIMFFKQNHNYLTININRGKVVMYFRYKSEIQIMFQSI